MFQFILNSLLLGVGLTMDAFSVSIANGLNEPNMRKRKATLIAITFALFQLAMPLIGWVCIETIATQFTAFTYFIPWIALLLLAFIGGKMVYGFFFEKEEENDNTSNIKKLGFLALMIQGVATSIDALSVGFTLTNYSLGEWYMPLISSIIIGVVTFLFCIVGVILGKKIGSKFSKVAELIGGLILIGIGIEIFISNMIDLGWAMPWQAF